MNHFNNYYVYMLKYEKRILYIGYGNGDRINHVLSGISHNNALNNFVAHGYDKNKLMLIKIAEDLTKDVAQIMEYKLLRVLNPLFNINVSNSTALMVAEYLYDHKREMSKRFLNEDDYDFNEWD